MSESDPRLKNPSMTLAPLKPSKLRPNTLTIMPAVPLSTYPLIGLIAVYQSGVEREFDILLSGFVAACPEAKDAEWDRQSFLKRCSFFLNKANLLFPDCPELLKTLQRLVDEIRLRYAQRNVIVHGQYEASFPSTVGNQVRLHVIGKPYRERAEFEFTDDDLETIRHEYGALLGALSSIFTDDRPNYLFSLSDRQTLRDRVRKYLPDPSKRPTLRRLPISAPR